MAWEVRPSTLRNPRTVLPSTEPLLYDILPSIEDDNKSDNRTEGEIVALENPRGD